MEKCAVKHGEVEAKLYLKKIDVLDRQISLKTLPLCAFPSKMAIMDEFCVLTTILAKQVQQCDVRSQ